MIRKRDISKLATMLLSTVTLMSIVSADDLTSPSTITGSSPVLEFITNPAAENGDWQIGSFANDDNTNTFKILNSTLGGYDLGIDKAGEIHLSNGSVYTTRNTAELQATVALQVNGDMRIRDWRMNASANPGQPGGGFWMWHTPAAVPQTPLKIANEALTNTLVVGSNIVGSEGNVGIGTDTPTSKLTVVHDGAGTESVYSLVTLTANDTDGGPSEAAFVLNNELYSKKWLFRTIDNGEAFTATLGGTGGAEFKVSSPTGHVSGTELYLGNGAKNVGGVWINASSRALKENIKPLSTKEALTAFNKLQPVTYNYKTDKSEQVVGFIAEDVPALVAINSRDGLSAMDMVAVLTKVTQEQVKQLKAQSEKIAKLELMQKRLAKVESLLTNLALDTSNSKKEKVSLNKQ